MFEREIRFIVLVIVGLTFYENVIGRSPRSYHSACAGTNIAEVNHMKSNTNSIRLTK